MDTLTPIREKLLELYREYRPWYNTEYDLDHELGRASLAILEPLMIVAGMEKPDDWPEDWEWGLG